MQLKKWNTKETPASIAALALAVLAAVVFPLFFHDYFFDINRAKLALLQTGAYAGAGICVLAFLGYHVVKKDFRSVRMPRLTLADAGIALFILGAAVSTYFSAYRAEAVTGGAGRQSGLLFLLALALLYGTLSRALRAQGLILALYVAAGTLAAALGIANFYLIDPFGFYENMKESQTIIFISTIGNINFFGIYVCMVLCVACAWFTHARGRWSQGLLGLCALTGFYGTVVSRSDGAMLGVLLLLALLFFEALEDPRRLFRVYVLILLYALALSCVRVVGVASGWYGYPFQGGLIERLVKSRFPFYLTVAAMTACLCGFVRARGGAALPARKIRRVLLTAGGVLAGLLLALCVYFTCINPACELGAMTQFLRFDDAWGTYRGFAWTRTLKAYAGFTPFQKIFGTGPDTMRYALAPYRDPAIEAAANGVFENSHNEYLQYLGTLGAVGLLGYVLFMAGSIQNAWRMRRTREGLALLMMECVYAPLALVNVNQPVTVVQFFLAASLAASLVNTRRSNGAPAGIGGETDEPGSTAGQA